VRRFHRPIARVVLRTSQKLGSSSLDQIEDLIQEVYLKLCADDFRLLREFVEEYPEAFNAYIKVVTSNVVRDHFRELRTHKRGSQSVHVDADSSFVAIGESHPGSPRSIERTVLFRELSRQLDNCVTGPDRARNTTIFWLHYRLGLSAASIASLPGIGLGTKGVESMIVRITRALKSSLGSRRPPEDRGSNPEGIVSAESL